jgi:hypothetical protein
MSLTPVGGAPSGRWGKCGPEPDRGPPGAPQEGGSRLRDRPPESSRGRRGSQVRVA